jgi:hypothetical protein
MGKEEMGETRSVVCWEGDIDRNDAWDDNKTGGGLEHEALREADEESKEEWDMERHWGRAAGGVGGGGRGGDRRRLIDRGPNVRSNEPCNKAALKSKHFRLSGLT